VVLPAPINPTKKILLPIKNAHHSHDGHFKVSRLFCQT
jgi:hypothetical protein